VKLSLEAIACDGFFMAAVNACPRQPPLRATSARNKTAGQADENSKSQKGKAGKKRREIISGRQKAKMEAGTALPLFHFAFDAVFTKPQLQ
jgi:hypothetical protein